MAGKWLIVALGAPTESVVRYFPSARQAHVARLGRMELRVLARAIAAASGQLTEPLSTIIESLEGASATALLGDAPTPPDDALGSYWLRHTAPTLTIQDAVRYFRAPSRVVFEHARVVSALAGAFFWKTCEHEHVFASSNSQLLDAQYLPTEMAMEGRGIFFEERLLDTAIDLGAIPQGAIVTRILDGGGWRNVSELTATITFEYSLSHRTHRVTMAATALAPPPPQRPEAEARRIEQEQAQLAAVGIPSAFLRVRQAVVYQIQHSSLAQALSTSPPNTRLKLLSQAAELSAALDVLTLQDTGPEPLALVLTTPDDLTPAPLTNYLSTDGAAVFWADATISPWAVATKLPPSNSPFLRLLLGEITDSTERLHAQNVYAAAMRASAHAQ